MGQILGYLILLVIAAFVVFTIFVIAKMFRERTKTMNADLPDLNELNKDTTEEKHEQVEHVDGLENSAALSVSSKTKVNREDYIKGEKKTSFDDDFGHVFDAEKKLHQRKEPTPKKEVKIEMNKIDLPNLDDENKTKDGE